jgi:hypothetical protein
MQTQDIYHFAPNFEFIQATWHGMARISQDTKKAPESPNILTQPQGLSASR